MIICFVKIRAEDQPIFVNLFVLLSNSPITFFQFKKKAIRADKGTSLKENYHRVFSFSCLSFLCKALLLYIHDHYWGSFLLDPIVYSLLIHLDLCFKLGMYFEMKLFFIFALIRFYDPTKWD